MFRRRSQGFALPTVVVSSVVLFAVLVSAMGAVASVQASLRDQLDQALARDAAESGTVYAEYCYSVANPTATTGQWPKAGTTLDTDNTCFGAPRAATCTDTPAKCYVAENGNTRSTFSVSAATVSGITYQFKSQGQTTTARASGGTSAPTVTASMSFKSNVSVTGIVSGNDTTCAIQQAKLYCWGKNNYGQVGNGTTTTVTTPTLVQGPFAGKFVYAVGTGISHTCAIAGTTSTISTTAQLYCWGSNSLYQYGIGNNTTSSTIPMLAASSASFYPAAVSARDHTCLIIVLKTNSADRRQVCFGNNSYGQAGESGGANATPTLLDPKPSMGYAFRLRASPYNQLTQVRQINAVSGNTSCGIAVYASSYAYCIGRNNAGQLGDGTTSGTNPRVQYATSAAKTIVSNSGKVCVIRIDSGYDRVWCWGGNGAVSDGPPDYRLDSGPNFSGSSEHGTPKRLVTAGVLFNKTITDLAVSDWNICQVMGGKVYCSGYNDKGQLGQGTVSGPAGGSATSTSQVRSANNAIQVRGELEDKVVTKIEGGNDHFCAVTSDAGVYCWGSNTLGQLGDGTTSANRTRPVKVKLPPPVLF